MDSRINLLFTQTHVRHSRIFPSPEASIVFRLVWSPHDHCRFKSTAAVSGYDNWPVFAVFVSTAVCPGRFIDQRPDINDLSTLWDQRGDPRLGTTLDISMMSA